MRCCACVGCRQVLPTQLPVASTPIKRQSAVNMPICSAICVVRSTADFLFPRASVFFFHRGACLRAQESSNNHLQAKTVTLNHSRDGLISYASRKHLRNKRACCRVSAERIIVTVEGPVVCQTALLITSRLSSLRSLWQTIFYHSFAVSAQIHSSTAAPVVRIIGSRRRVSR